MKPLMLPRLVAAKNSQAGSSTIDERVSAASADSTLSASKGSTPLNLMSAAHDHLRHSSSISFTSSLPSSSYKHVDSMASLSKLPRLAEDPIEEPFKPEVRIVEEDLEGSQGAWCLCSMWCHVTVFASTPNNKIGVTEGCPHCNSPIGDDSDVKPLQRRRGLRESPANSIGSRVSERIPSLTRQWMGSGAVSTLSREDTHTSTPPSERSCWSSSLASSVPRRSLNISETELPPILALASGAYEDRPTSNSPVDIVTTALAIEPIDREALASTPLLPPLIVDKRPPESTWQSPLQSPPVVDSCAAFAAISSALGIPVASSVQTPTSSIRRSLASFRYSGPNHVLLYSDIPPMTDYDDKHNKWSINLGHANFTISPEPYVPEVCDAAACRELFARWEQARRNYTKHQVRTREHFGVTSETYKLTEQKWSEIDAQWKRCHDMAVAHAAEAIRTWPCADLAACRI
ncbi:hypothetical protein B0J12DRAFT_752219 [Macrophomina phaseolina]|uniref:Uncharacterized protein n=1 Tax=Macrophomina phaseolina TaxID=35725 RepID=A0ABQ8FQ99_9PEZI|nr:hypothetical protein B0J12DRAFT_752219 [Macrophomina phaseolina]